MLRTLCASTRSARVICSIYTKNAITTTIRHKSDVFSVSRSHRKQQQQPVEYIKWVLLVIPVTSFGLGCWQIHRLRWKLELIDRMQAKSNSQPVEMPRDFAELDKMEYQPVRVRGQFIHDKEFLIGPRALIEPDSPRFGSLVSDPKKNQGWHVVTPFVLKETGEVILVNRGWVPTELKGRDARAPSLVQGDVELIGIVRLTEKRPPFMPKNQPESNAWYTRDLEQMADNIGCSPVWLDARGSNDPPAGWPIPNQTRVKLRNEHASYVVTWLSLAATTGFMWHRYFVRKLPLL